MRMTFIVFKRVSKFFLRDKRLIALMLVVPLVMALVIGYGFGGEINNIEVEIVNYDESTITQGPLTISFSEIMIEWLDEETDKIDVTIIENPTIESWEESKNAVLEKQIKGAILFPVNFTVDIFASINLGSAVTTSIDTYIDNTNPQIGSTIIRALSEVLEEVFSEATGLSINAEFAYGADLTQLQYMAPSILPFAIFFMAFILSIISFVTERKNGTLDILLLSPYNKINIILGYMLTLTLVSIVQSTIILTLIIFLFNVPIIGGVGSYFAIYMMSIFTAWCGMGLGFLLSSVAKSELQAIQFIPMVTFACLLLSGTLTPLEALPVWLQPISYVIPITYSANYLRDVMIGGAGFLFLSWDILGVLAFVIVMIGASWFTLKQK
ncbi:MAG: ABC transporter permease [Candidatus Heimdallarchaeota archaeon]